MAEFAPTVPRHNGQVFLFYCEDGPGASSLRLTHLEGHLKHVEKNHDRYIIAGPMRPTGNLNTDGSFFLILAETEEDAWAVTRGDPYFYTGMYENITVRCFTPAVGKYLGGVTWDSAESVEQFATRARKPEEM